MPIAEREWATPARPPIHRGWRSKWHLKDLLEVSDYPTPEETRESARKMHERLEKLRVEDWGGYWKFDPEIEQISDEFHTIGFVDEVPSCSEFNAVMEALYNWADDERVWIE